MSYRIGKNEKPGQGLRRVAREELKCAVAPLDAGGELEPVLHEVRRRLKRLRSLLLLAEQKPANRIHKRLGALVRTTARRIGSVRDMHVQIRTLQKLRKHCRKSKALELCQTLQARFEREASSTNAGHLLRETAIQLNEAVALLEKWPPETLAWSTVCSACKRARREHFKQMRKALADFETESLHEWRKCAKVWWHQTQLLNGHSDEDFEGLFRKLKELGDCLGEDHDLSLIRKDLGIIKSPAALKLLSIIKKHRARLQKRAARLGRKLVHFQSIAGPRPPVRRGTLPPRPQFPAPAGKAEEKSGGVMRVGEPDIPQDAPSHASQPPCNSSVPQENHEDANMTLEQEPNNPLALSCNFAAN
jgi:CHAD domain-containing protein